MLRMHYRLQSCRQCLRIGSGGIALGSGLRFVRRFLGRNQFRLFDPSGTDDRVGNAVVGLDDSMGQHFEIS